MKLFNPCLRLAILFVLLVIPTGSAAFQYKGIYEPTRVKLEGVILGSKEVGGHYVLTFQTRNTTIRFNVTDIQIRGSSEWTNGWMYLNRLAPKSLRLIGGKETLAFLARPDTVGKGLIIYGAFHTNSTFYMEEVEEASPIQAP